MSRATSLQASLLGDALALPAHWIYDPATIAARFGRVADLVAPPEDGYHRGQPAGGQTHYGAQALELVRAIAEAGRFDAEVFARRWRAMWAAPTWYVDGATRDTLAKLAEGVAPGKAGSRSSDLGGAARVAPLLAAMWDAPEAEVVEAAWAQTTLTHRDPAVGEAAAFLVRAARAAAGGAGVEELLVRAAMPEYLALPVKAHLANARRAAGEGDEAIAALGLACPVGQAFPAVLALALRHGDDLEGALVANVMLGGDSAARGLALGMILGARPGAEVPARWLAAWGARAEVDRFLASTDPAARAT